MGLCSPATAGPCRKGYFGPNLGLVFPWSFFRSDRNSTEGRGCLNSFYRSQRTLLTSAPDCWVINEKSPGLMYHFALGKNFPETQLIFPLLPTSLHGGTWVLFLAAVHKERREGSTGRWEPSQAPPQSWGAWPLPLWLLPGPCLVTTSPGNASPSVVFC